MNFAQVAPLAMALLVLTAGLLGYAWRQGSARNATLAAELAAISGQIRLQERLEPGPAQGPAPQSVPVSRPERPSSRLIAVREPAVAPRPNSNEAELAKLHQDYAAAIASAKDAEDRFKKITDELQRANAQLILSDDAMTKLQDRLKSAEAATEQAKGELQVARVNLGESSFKIADLSRENRELTVKLSAPTQLVHQSNVLFAPGRDLGDQLLDLRSVDVHDVDSKGKESKASARVFYTDGKSKSLLLIATGLSKRTVAKGDVFQVWGARGMSGASPRSLGHFELDNKETDLWALAVNDPAKLAGVDTVFVTQEKGGESEKPTTDKRIMDAYLPQIPIKR
jgi:hypothetical protein